MLGLRGSLGEVPFGQSFTDAQRLAYGVEQYDAGVIAGDAAGQATAEAAQPVMSAVDLATGGWTLTDATGMVEVGWTAVGDQYSSEVVEWNDGGAAEKFAVWTRPLSDWKGDSLNHATGITMIAGVGRLVTPPLIASGVRVLYGVCSGSAAAAGMAGFGWNAGLLAGNIRSYRAYGSTGMALSTEGSSADYVYATYPRGEYQFPSLAYNFGGTYPYFMPISGTSRARNGAAVWNAALNLDTVNPWCEFVAIRSAGGGAAGATLSLALKRAIAQFTV